MTKHKTKWNWTAECEKAFEELKEKLTTAPILGYPRIDGEEFILNTDASAYAICAVLSQVQDGVEQVIACGSRVLTKAERNYCCTRREMLAIVFFTRYFKHYLLGRRFTVRTDHGSLTWLQKFKEADGQIHRWIQQLSQFHMKIVHRKGQGHGNADALSRLVRPSGMICKQCEMPWDYTYVGPSETEIKNISEGYNLQDTKDDKSNCAVDESNLEHMDADQDNIVRQQRGRKVNKPQPARQKQTPSTSLTNDVIRKSQEEDKILSEILKMKEENHDKPIHEDISNRDPEFKFWIGRWELLEVRDNVLCIY